MPTGPLRAEARARRPCPVRSRSTCVRFSCRTVLELNKAPLRDLPLSGALFASVSRFSIMFVASAGLGIVAALLSALVRLAGRAPLSQSIRFASVHCYCVVSFCCPFCLAAEARGPAADAFIGIRRHARLCLFALRLSRGAASFWYAFVCFWCAMFVEMFLLRNYGDSILRDSDVALHSF